MAERGCGFCGEWVHECQCPRCDGCGEVLLDRYPRCECERKEQEEEDAAEVEPPDSGRVGEGS